MRRPAIAIYQPGYDSPRGGRLAYEPGDNVGGEHCVCVAHVQPLPACIEELAHKVIALGRNIVALDIEDNGALVPLRVENAAHEACMNKLVMHVADGYGPAGLASLGRSQGAP